MKGFLRVLNAITGVSPRKYYTIEAMLLDFQLGTRLTWGERLIPCNRSMDVDIVDGGSQVAT
jgi:hypothetical protein